MGRKDRGNENAACRKSAWPRLGLCVALQAEVKLGFRSHASSGEPRRSLQSQARAQAEAESGLFFLPSHSSVWQQPRDPETRPASVCIGGQAGKIGRSLFSPLKNRRTVGRSDRALRREAADRWLLSNAAAAAWRHRKSAAFRSCDKKLTDTHTCDSLTLSLFEIGS